MADDPIDWRSLINIAAPVAGMLASNGPGGSSGFMQGYLNARNADLQRRQTKQAIDERRNQQAADYLLKIGEHADTFDDPVQLAQFTQLAEDAGVKAGFLKPGELQGRFTVSPSKVAQKRLGLVGDQLDALEKGGYNLDDLATGGAHMRLADGTDVPVSTALDLTNRRPVDASGQRIGKPTKAGTTDEDRFLAKRAREQGYDSLDNVDTYTQNDWRREFRDAGRAEPKASTAPDQRAIDLRGQMRDAKAKGDTAAFNKAKSEYDDIVGALNDLSSAKRKPEPAAGLGADIEIKPGTKEYRIATDLSTGDITFAQMNRLLSSRATSGQNIAALRESIYDKARELNPNFSPAQFEAGYKFASSPKIKQQVASINNVLSGVDDLVKVSDAAQRTGVTFLNQFVNKGGYAIGGKSYSNLAIARKAFADELSGALGYGSATDMAREMGLDMTDPNLSPANFKAAIRDVVVPFVQRKKASILGEMGPYAGNGGGANGGGAAGAAGSTFQVGGFSVKVK